MPDLGTTSYPATDNLQTPTDWTISPTAAGDGLYNFRQWVERVTGFIRAIWNDFVIVHKPDVNAHHARDHDLAGSTHTAASTNLSLNNHKIVNLADGSGNADAATWGQVQALLNGLDWGHPSARAATTASITLSGAQTIDGVSVIAGDRVLVKDQSTGSQNGIYVAAAGAWTRATDADSSAEMNPGLAIVVEEGTVNGDTVWLLTTNAPITLDTTALTFLALPTPNALLAGAGLTRSGNTLNVIANADGSITVNADDVQLTLDATAPTTSAVGDAAAAGSAARAARRDHAHGREAFGAPGSSAVGDSVANGSASTLARSDHRHGREAFATNGLVLGSAAAAGAATTPMRSDDTIAAFDATAPTTSAVGDAAATGSAAKAARRDHVHGREAFATNGLVLGSAAAAGVAATPLRSDDTIAAFDATAPTTSAVGDAAAVGSAAKAARRDHVHGREAFGAVTAQTSFGGASANGSAATLARSDHTHGSPSLGTSSTTATAGNGPFVPSGFTGATAASRYVGATASGAPTSGTFAVGDFVIDQVGKVWICTAAGTPGTWVSPSDHGRPFKTGRYYSGELQPGASSTVAMVANTAYALPFPVGVSKTFDRFAINITTAGAAATVIRLGIYGSTDGIPDALIGSATSVAGDATGDPSTATISQALTPGLYWLVAVAQGGTPTVRMTPSTGRSAYVGRTDGAIVNMLGYQGSYSGALPANFTVADIIAQLPILQLRAA